MARRKSPVAEAIANAQASEIIANTAESMAMPPETAVLDQPDVFDAAIAAQDTRKPDPSGRYPNREKLAADDLLHTIEPTPERGIIGYHIDGGSRNGGASVSLVDDRQGLGIKFHTAEKPSAAVLEAVKEAKTYKDKPVAGPKWEPKLKEWRKRFSDNQIGDRIDMEERVLSAADRLREERLSQDGPSRG